MPPSPDVLAKKGCTLKREMETLRIVKELLKDEMRERQAAFSAGMREEILGYVLSTEHLDHSGFST